MSGRQMTQTGPWPTELEDLVGRARLAYPGWSMKLEEGTYDDGQVTQLRLIITVAHFDSYHPENPRRTQFHYPVPVVAWDRASWQRWIRDMLALVHVHEDGEALAFAYERPVQDTETGEVIEDVVVLERPFAPQHGPGRDPNRQVEVGVDPMEQRIAQWGGRYPGWWWDGTTVHDDTVHDRDCRGQSYGPPRCIPVQRVTG